MAELTPEELQQVEALRKGMADLSDQDPSWIEKAGAVAAGVVGDVGTGLKEAVPQVVRGAQEGLNAASDVSFGIADWLNKNIIDLDKLVLGRTAESTNSLKFSEDFMPAKAESVTGALVNDVSQFLVGFGVAGRALKAVGLTASTTAGGAVAHGMMKGAIADATFFDPHEERLSNLVEQYPRLSNPVTDFLSAKPEDTQAEGRFKNALEGLAMGGVVESLFHAVRAIKFKRMGDMQGAEKALDDMEKSGVKIDEEPLKDAPEPEAKAPEGEGAATAPADAPRADADGQLGLNLEGGGPRPDSPRETFGTKEGDVKPGDMAANIPPKKPNPENAEFKPAKKIVEVDDAALREIATASVNEKTWGQGRNISGIRTDLMESAEDITQTMSALRVVYREEAARAMGGNADGVRSWKNVERNADSLADLIGDDPRILLQRMQAIHKETFHADAELKLYRDMLVTVNDRLVQIAEVVADPLGGTGKYGSRAEAMADYAKHYELMSNMQLMYKGIQTNFARTMNAMKLTAEARKGVLPDNVDGLFAGGEREMVKSARRIVANKENVKGNLQLTRGGFVSKMLNGTNEYWINSILSGPKTHMANILSNTINTVVVPGERMLAGIMQFDSAVGRAEFYEGALQYVGFISQFRDSLGLAAKSLAKGDPILDAAGKLDYDPVISAAGLGISDPAASMAVNGLGTLVRLPSRFLTAEDEFFKQLMYRSAVQAKAWREGLGAGMMSDPKKFGEFVSKRLDDSTGPLGEALDTEALSLAKEATFTQDLKAATHGGGRTLGETLQAAGAAHPTLRLIMPFVRTPTNIMRTVWNHTPGLNFARKQYADDIMGRNGSKAQGRAQAQLLTGGLMWGAAISYATEGKVTGGGPVDPEIRKALMDTGWRPYSIKVENDDGTVEYLGYNRMDPFGMFFGLAADYAETANAWPEKDMEDRATMVAVALAKNLGNKSYLTGLVGALNAFSEPGPKTKRYFQQLASGFVPTALQQIGGTPEMREARSIVDGMRRKMPGYAEELDHVRNILGEKLYIPPSLGPDWVSPVSRTVHPGGPQPATEEWKRTPSTDVYDELARQMYLHNSGLKVSPNEVGKVDLTQWRSPVTGKTAADRFRELQGTVVINGKTLKQELAELFASPTYRETLSDGNFDFDGSRIKVIQSTVQGYREAAKAELGREIPAVYWAFIEAQRMGAMAMQPEQNRPLELTVKKRVGQ